MTTFLRLLKAAWDFVLGAIADFLEWLRKPGSKLKLLCGLLAIAFFIAALNAYRAEQRVVSVTTERDAEKSGREADQAKFKEREQELLSKLATYQKQERDFEDAVRKEAERLLEARAQSAAATAEVKRRQEAAEKSTAAFKREAANKPDTCKAALKALEAACPTLRDY